MKLGQCTLENFGSYVQLDFDFGNQGLALVQGATGAGKSTLEDAPAWVLFGLTAKGGSVDDVRNWSRPNDPTQGVIEVTLPTGENIVVTRVRGRPNQNDLYWTEGGERVRGKDLNETQKLLEQRLGITSELYLLGAYFHEFSSSGSFFTAKAKDRREMFESIAPLAFPGLLADAASARRKVLKSEVIQLQSEFDTLKGAIRQGEISVKQLMASAEAWNRTQDALLTSLEYQAATYIAERTERLARLNSERLALSQWETSLGTHTRDLTDAKAALYESVKQRCSECGGPAKHTDADALRGRVATLESLIQEARSEGRQLARLDKEITALSKSDNTPALRLSEERTKANPYLPNLESAYADLEANRGNLDAAASAVGAKRAEIDAVSTLHDLSAQLRGELVRKAVQEIEERTNQHLERHFDAEIRVVFTLKSDAVDVTLHKSGYECNYRQLSKGQRGLLKLAFTAAVMTAAANSAGVHFGTVFLDEALDGLDSDLKVKAFGLLQELAKEHDSVFVIDHAEEFKTLFDKRYHVKLESDASVIYEC